ncbi:MAG: M56 family metallopeptidase [Eubacteriales bacterium]|nr:M56 family metallopeptidase [Eubacteriales bacterium]
MIRTLIHFLSNVVFPQILEMTVIASIVILAVVIVRFFIRKSPKVFSYLLWSVVLFRLLCPISFSTNMSMFNLNLFDIPMVHDVQNAATRIEITNNNQTAETPGTAVANDISKSKIETTTTENITDNNKSITAISVITTVWFVGMLLLFVTNLISFLKLKIKTAACLKVRDNIYIADEIDTPFCFGFVHPKIYLPSNLQEREMEYIIIHEQTHIRRMDHIVKMLAFVALIVHWFNPLVWLAFILACKDIEMSCDETVLRKMKGDIRQEYCMSILQLATRKRISLASPLSFADGDPKRRIKNVMNYKKPRIGITILSILICIFAGVGLSSNAKTTKADHNVIAENTENTIVQETTDNNTTTDSLQEITDEQVINEHLHDFCVPTDMNISDIKYYLYDNTLEIHFVYEDHTYLIAKIAEATSYEDISDANYPWTFETDELSLLDRPTHTTSYFSDTESVMLLTWFEANKGVNVSLEAMGQDLDGFDLFTVAERMLP